MTRTPRIALLVVRRGPHWKVLASTFVVYSARTRAEADEFAANYSPSNGTITFDLV